MMKHYVTAAFVVLGLSVAFLASIAVNLYQEVNQKEQLYLASNSRLQVEVNKAGQYESTIQVMQGRVADVMALNAEADSLNRMLQAALAKRPKAEAVVVYVAESTGKASAKVDTVFVAADNTPIYKGQISEEGLEATVTASRDSVWLNPYKITVPYEVVLAYERKNIFSRKVPTVTVTPLHANTKAVQVKAWQKGKPKGSAVPEILSGVAGFALAVSLLK